MQLQGSPCGKEGCKGKLRCKATKISDSGDSRIRYYYCSRCNWRPEENKQIIPTEFSPPRSTNRTKMT